MPRALLLLMLLAACRTSAPERALVRQDFRDVLFATRFDLRLAGTDAAELERAAEAAFAEGRRVEALASVWQADSAVARFNAAAVVAGTHPVPAELARLVSVCLSFCAESRHAYDPTVGALLWLYGYYAGQGPAPSQAQLEEARARVGCDVAYVPEFSEAPGVPGVPDAPDVRMRTIVTRVDGVRLDLGGVAKGWAVDRMAGALRAAGVEHALISGGGSAVVAFGDDPQDAFERAGWPFEIELGATTQTWRLADEALAVSGQLSQPVFVGGRLASHIVDPRTGVPVEHGTLLCIVRGPSATGADLASTAALVLGSQAAERWLADARVRQVWQAWAVDVDPNDRDRRVVRRLR